jgi:hypothetical protein
MHVTCALDQDSQMEKEMCRMRQYGTAVVEGTLRCMLHTQNHICKTKNLILSHVRYPLATVVTICTTTFNIQKFYVPHRVHLCVLYGFGKSMKCVIHLNIRRQKKRRSTKNEMARPTHMKTEQTGMPYTLLLWRNPSVQAIMLYWPPNFRQVSPG